MNTSPLVSTNIINRQIATLFQSYMSNNTHHVLGTVLRCVMDVFFNPEEPPSGFELYGSTIVGGL